MKPIKLFFKKSTLLIFFSASFLYSQTTDSLKNTIEIDFLKPFKKKIKKINKDDVINVSFKNVNPFLYKIKVLVNEKLYHEEKQSLGDVNFLSSYVYKLPDGSAIPDFEITFNNQTGNNQTDKKEAFNEREILKEKQEKLNQARSFFYDYKRNAYRLNSITKNLQTKKNTNLSDTLILNEKKRNFEVEIKNWKTSRDEVIDNINKYFSTNNKIKSEKNLDSIINTISLRIEKVDSLIKVKDQTLQNEKYYIKLKELIDEYKNEYEKLQFLYVFYISFKNIIFSSSTITDIKVKKKQLINSAKKAFETEIENNTKQLISSTNKAFKTNIENNTKQLSSSKKKISKVTAGFELNELNELPIKVFKIKSNLNNIIINIQDLSVKEPAKNKIITFHSNINMSIIDNLVQGIITMNNSINSYIWNPSISLANFDYRTDDLEIKVKLEPINNPFGIIAPPKDYPFSLAIDRGTKFNISVGTSFLFGLNDFQYKWSPNPENNTSSILTRENSAGDFSPYLTTFLNIFWRDNSQVKPTINIGLGTNIDKISYFLGGGLILGRQERVIFHAGVAGLNVRTPSKSIEDLFKKNNNLNSIIIEQPFDEVLNQNIVTEKYRIGYYFGFSYNLSDNKTSRLEKKK